MKARNTGICLADMDLRVIEQETIARAEEVLGGIPEWYLENKEQIEHNRVEAKALTKEFMARLKKIMSMCRQYQ